MPLDYHQNHYLHLLAQEKYYYMSLVTVTKLSVIECLLRMFPCLSPFSSLVTMYFEYSETQLITIVKVFMQHVLNIFPFYNSETKNLVSIIYSPGSYDSRSWNFDDHCYLVLVIMRIKGSNLCTKTDMSFSLENVSKNTRCLFCFHCVGWHLLTCWFPQGGSAGLFSNIWTLVVIVRHGFREAGGEGPPREIFLSQLFSRPHPSLKGI